MNQDTINQFNNRLLLLPGELRHEALAVFDEISDQLPDSKADTLDWAGVLPAVLSFSPFVVSLLRRNPAFLSDLIDNGELFLPLDPDKLSLNINQSLAATEDEQEIMRILRTLRNQAMLHIAFRDLAGWSSLEETMADISRTAEIILTATLSRTHELLRKKSGAPFGADSAEEQKMLILGMGKLGGGELNFSSDVDLIFCFPENGETSSKRPITNSEFFIRQARLLIKLLSTQTADGFVYRIDTRLRPNGDSGPLCLSFTAMDNYYQLHGRDWERYAYIKAHVVAGSKEQGKQLLDSLRPFVYRKYLDFSAIESIRNMKEMIERELLRKKEIEKNIKLGPGGIREVEFIAQAHQLIRGGRDTVLQQRSLLSALSRLFEASLVTENEYNFLLRGYTFLRRCENRLQMYADQQTHNLPDDTSQRLVLAYSMQFSDWQLFEADLRQHMQNIHQIFHNLFMSTAHPDQDAKTRSLSHLWNNELDDESAVDLLAKNHYQNAAELYVQLRTLRTGSLYRSLSSAAKDRLDRLLPVLLHEVGNTTGQTDEELDEVTNTDDTILRCLELLSSIARRPVYLSLLLDNEAVRHQLIRLTSTSPYASVLLKRYPILLDDLLIGYSLTDFYANTLLAQLAKQLSVIEQGDLEQQMNLLREFHHSKLLAVAALDVSNKLSARDTGISLSAIAEACIVESLKLSIQGISSNHGFPESLQRDTLPFCIIAYGKLGSRELGFGSDLDLVFVSESFDDAAKTNGPKSIYIPQFFARIGQRLVHIISTRTAAGRCYEIDMRLRPSGESGPLVTTITRLQGYLRGKAWTWEHQALVKARVIAGGEMLKKKFDALRKEILMRSRDEENLQDDIVKMREKMRSAKISLHSGKFDLKQGRGGIVDIEFMVQYAVLRWAHDYPQLTAHTETQDLLDELKNLTLLEHDQHRILSLAFSTWLEKSYQLKLNELDAVIPDSAEKPLRLQVTEIWNKMFPRNAGLYNKEIK